MTLVPDIRRQFAPAPGITYLDSATYGLPPEATIRAMREALDAWQAGTADWMLDWDRPAEGARASFAALVGVAPDRVAFLPAASVGVGIVAAGLGPHDEVVVPADEFTSTLFPFLVARERGVAVREVPFERLAEAIGGGTTLVAFSLVQMQTGRMADLAAILDGAEAVGARVLVDATQAIPLVPLAGSTERIDYLVAAAYKHLLCPRGVAFLAVRQDRLAGLEPLVANWRAADEPYGRYFGGPLTLAPDAARLDVSLAWLPWVGAVESLRLLEAWAPTGAFEEALLLARDLAARVGIPWAGGSLVCVPIRDADADAVRAALREAGIRSSVRGTAVRFSTHVYNGPEDVERAAAAVAPFLGR